MSVEKKNMESCIVSAALLRKLESGTYIGTGWTQANVSSDEIRVPFGGHVPGSFCLMLTVKPRNSITIVMEVPCYFIIKPTE